VKIYQVLSANDAEKMLTTVTSMEWNTGQARTKELTGTVKQNLEILSSNSNKVAQSLLAVVGKQIMSHRSIGLDCIPLKLHTPKFNKYVDGGRYYEHTDAPWMGDVRTDIACTVWLSDPSSYDGGELCIGSNKIKGKPGEALLYDCGVVHSVNPVMSGERVCIITWVQSRIRDPIKRKLISDFRKWLAKMEGTEFFAEGSIIYSALLKRWME